MVVVKFNKPWFYHHDIDGNAKTSFPRGLVAEIEDEVAAAAIADGAAVAMRPLTPAMQRRVAMNARIVALASAGMPIDEAVETAVLEEQEALASSAPPAAPPAQPKAAKKKAHA